MSKEVFFDTMVGRAPQEFYTRKQLAELFSVCPATVIRWESAGLLESIHLHSGSVRYSKAAVANFISQQQQARPTKGTHEEANAQVTA